MIEINIKTPFFFYTEFCRKSEEKQSHRGRTMNIKKILKPVLLIVLALVLGAAVIAMVGENPLSVYRSMLLGAFGSKMSIQKDSCWKPARIIWSLQMKN